jgi:hypothetical protein
MLGHRNLRTGIVLDFLFGSIQAYNQVGLFIGALLCLGLGGLILGNSLYWRLHALRAPGTIVGLVDTGGSYFPVYRYALPDGQTQLAKSNTGSSSVRGKETGRVVPLMISAHDPAAAQEADSYLLDLFGLVLVAPGLWLGYVALTAYPITPMTWIMAVAMLLYLAERGHRILIPKGQRLSVAAWRQQHGVTAANPIDLAQVKRAEDILASADMRQAEQQQSRSSRKAVPLIGLFVVILVGVGILQGMKIGRLEAVGLHAPGRVVRLKEEFGSGPSSYYAIVRFRTNRNETVEFKDNIGGNPPSHRPGDQVTVLYLADSPRQEAIIDRGIWWNWGIPGILMLCAAGLVWLMIALRRSATPPSTSQVAGGALASPWQSRA